MGTSKDGIELHSIIDMRDNREFPPLYSFQSMALISAI